jgi:hypothetical protein
MNQRDQCCVSNKQWVNFPIRLQKHLHLADGQEYPKWFLSAFEHKKNFSKVFHQDDETNAFAKKLYLCSLYFAKEDGSPNMQFIEEYKQSHCMKKNTVRAYDIECAIASYPQEVLQKIQILNGKFLAEGKPELLTKTIMYFQAARPAAKLLESKLFSNFYSIHKLYFIIL